MTTITVLGSTGRTGGRAARTLLESGVHVRAVGRSHDRLAELIDLGAEPWVGDACDDDFLTVALDGVDAATVMLPFDPSIADVREHLGLMSRSITSAISRSSVKRVVALSSIGADMESGTGVLTTLHRLEKDLGDLDANVLFLRPGYFYDNMVPAIIHDAVVADSIDPDVSLPMVATSDVGDALARAALSQEWSGHVVRELIGPEFLTQRDLAARAGFLLGIDGVEYVHMADAELVKNLVREGFSPNAADLLVEMHRGFSDGTVASRGTGLVRAATTFDEYFASAVLAAAR